ncbi:MAG: prepilin peptidase [Thermoproteota archaeon]|nr:prepilin peptidase [Candidatus Brockarchaeota archaeon]
MLTVTRIKILTSLLLLSYASLKDLKYREVSDTVWLFFSIFALFINIVSFFILRYFYIDVVSVAYVLVLLVIFFTLYYAGAYGGADAKALTCITLMFPFLSEEVSLSGFTLLPVPVATFFYASVLSLVQVVLNLIHNLLLVFKREKVFEGINEPISKKILALLLLRKEYVRKSDLNLFFTPAEVTLKDGSRKLIFFSNSNSNFTVSDGELIFVSPLIPFVPFLVFGFLLFIVFGDSMVVKVIEVVISILH